MTRPVTDPELLRALNAMSKGAPLPPGDTLPRIGQADPSIRPEVLQALNGAAAGKMSGGYKTQWEKAIDQILPALVEQGYDKNIALDLAKSFAGGLTTGWTNLLTSVGAFLGDDQMVNYGMKGTEALDRAFGVDDPTWFDKFANGLGFMASLLIPGMGIGKIGKVSSAIQKGANAERMHMLLGAYTMSSFEAMMEAGSQIDSKVRMGMSYDEAAREAAPAILPNVIVSGVMNMPLFSSMRLFPKAVIEAATEGGQEIYQGYLSDWVMQEGGRGGLPQLARTSRQNWDQHWEEGGIGGAIGFAAGLIFGRKAGLKMRDHADKVDGLTEEEKKARDEKKAEAAHRGATLNEAIDSTMETDKGDMADYRDEVASLSDKDLGKRLIWMRDRAEAGSTDIETLHRYTAAWEEASYRVNSGMFAELESSKLMEGVEDVLGLAPEDRTRDEDTWAAHALVELIARDEIPLKEAQRLGKELGVPAWVVERIPVTEEPGVSPTPVTDPDLVVAYEAAALNRIGEEMREWARQREAAKAGVRGKRIHKPAGTAKGLQAPTLEMVKEANTRDKVDQPARNLENEQIHLGVRKATQALVQETTRQRRAAAGINPEGVSAGARAGKAAQQLLSQPKTEPQTKPEPRKKVSSGKKPASETLAKLLKETGEFTVRRHHDTGSSKWTGYEANTVAHATQRGAFGKNLSEITKLSKDDAVENMRATGTGSKEATQYVELVTQMVEAAGMVPIWVRPGRGATAGAMYVGMSNSVVLNANYVNRPHIMLATAVHEIAHGVMKGDFRTQVEKAMRDAGIEGHWIEALGDSYRGMDFYGQSSEILARIMEHPATKPEFWKALKKESPSAFRNVSERILELFKKLKKFWDAIARPAAIRKDVAIHMPGGFYKHLQRKGVKQSVLDELIDMTTKAIAEAGTANTQAAREKAAVETYGLTKEEVEKAKQVKPRLASESLVTSEKAKRDLARLREGKPLSRTAFISMLREVHTSWAASTAEAVADAALDPETGKVVSALVNDFLVGDFNGAILEGYELPLSEQSIEDLEAGVARVDAAIQSEFQKMNPNQILKSQSGKVATRELGYLMAEWTMLNAELDRRNGGPRDVQHGREIDTLPFRALDPDAAMPLALPPRKQYKNPTKKTDGQAMRDALTRRTAEREEVAQAREKAAKFGLNFWNKKYVDWVDNLHGLKVVLDKGLKAAGIEGIDAMHKSLSPYHTFRAITRAWTSVADSFMNRGVRSMLTGELMRGDKTKGMNQILADPKYKIAENYDQFGEYLIAKRNISVFDAKPWLFASAEAQANLALARRVVPEVEAKHKNWSEAATELNRYSNDLVDYLVEAEVLSAEDASLIKNRYSFYAPMHLSEFVSEDGVYKENSGVFASRGVKAMRDIVGSNAIDNPLESMMRSTLAMVNAAHHNIGKLNTARVVRKIMQTDPNVGKHIGEIVNLDEFRKPLSKTRGEWYNISGLKSDHRSQLRKKLNTMGIKGAQAAEIVSALEIADQKLTEQKKVWFTSIELSEGLVAFIENGEFKIMRVHPEIYEGISSLSRSQADWLTKTAGNFTRLLREGAILSPEFMARNPIRDFFSAGVVAVNAITTPADVGRYMTAWVKSVYQVAGKSEIYDRWVMSGGPMSDLVSMDRAATEQNRKRNLATMETATRPGAVKYYLKDPRNWRAGLRAMTGVFEETTRLAVFKVLINKNLKAGMPLREAELAAAIESREASVDFQRRGRHAQLMNQIIPFFTATVGGLDKLVRTMSRGTPAQKAAAWLRAGILITVPTLLLWDRNKDEEWYKALPRYEKNLYWHIKLGESIGADGTVRNRFLRIPKPFELGLMFGSFFERFSEYVTDRDPRAMESWGKQFLSTAQPFHFEQMVPPLTSLYNAANNYDSFRQREIVKGTLQSMPARLQYSENTTTTARMIGDLLNIAPLKVDYYTRASFGGVGRYVSDILGAGIGALSDRWDTGRMPGREIFPGTGITEQAPILRAFVGSTPSAYDRYSDDFFKFLKKAEGYTRELDWTGQGRIPIEQLGRDIEDAAIWLALYPNLRSRAQEIGKLTRYAKTVQMDASGQFSDDEKRAITDKVFRARGTIMRAVVEEIDKILVDDDRMEQIRSNARAAFGKR